MTRRGRRAGSGGGGRGGLWGAAEPGVCGLGVAPSAVRAAGVPREGAQPGPRRRRGRGRCAGIRCFQSLRRREGGRRQGPRSLRPGCVPPDEVKCGGTRGESEPPPRPRSWAFSRAVSSRRKERGRPLVPPPACIFHDFRNAIPPCRGGWCWASWLRAQGCGLRAAGGRPRAAAPGLPEGGGLRPGAVLGQIGQRPLEARTGRPIPAGL